ncbi:MAG: thioredoxin [Lachnospiraceae bacterium]|nr:thioredoxin [Lachnospiraceae bacterium]MBQ8166317.1 thioredoxin [Lachnospiraceae bacterium]
MAAIFVSNENFESEVLKSDVPVLVDFWAPWCGPCQMLGPIVEDVAEENTDIKVCKVNVEENPDLAVQYKIMNIPTIVAFKNGEVYKKSVGIISKSEILELVK